MVLHGYGVLVLGWFRKGYEMKRVTLVIGAAVARAGVLSSIYDDAKIDHAARVKLNIHSIEALTNVRPEQLEACAPLGARHSPGKVF